MELLIFFICSWVFISVLLFMLNGHPEENETWSAFIFSIILISGILAIAGMIMLFIFGMMLLGTLALFGVIG